MVQMLKTIYIVITVYNNKGIGYMIATIAGKSITFVALFKNILHSLTIRILYTKDKTSKLETEKRLAISKKKKINAIGNVKFLISYIK